MSTTLRASPSLSFISDASGSDASLSHSRATTPASELACCEIPESCAFIPSAYLTPALLKHVFEKHATNSSLAVIVSNGYQLIPPTFVQSSEWSKFTDALATYFMTNSYVFKSFTAPVPMCTDSVHAKELHIISAASLRSVLSFSVEKDLNLHVLERPSVVFPPLSHTQSFSLNESTGGYGNIPTPEEWTNLWAAWDLVTLGMIPSEMLHQKPIDLRHKCLFYIGHIPTFLDMLISKSIGGSPSEPQYFWKIFERGIDPHVDDPEHCHNHSEVPERDEDWPSIETVISFRNNVRARLMALYEELKSGKRALTRIIARTLVMTIEHEGFHIETILYMLIQRAGAGTLPPPGITAPVWDRLVHSWAHVPSPSTPSVRLGPATVILGHNDSEGDDKLPEFAGDAENHRYGWDNENPARMVKVNAFRAEWRPVTNAEFEAFYHGSGKGRVSLPSSWIVEDGTIKMRTMYGPISMDIAAQWPVQTAYDDLVTFAQAKGGRLPTEPELRLLLDTYDAGFEGGANIGFRNWHPTPATMGLDQNGGKGSNGGVWEWTSTALDNHEGLWPTELFTGYSTDFFDAKHQVCLGASYATIPRIAGRRTVRNFYQHNYPYAWVGARVVYDI